MAASTVRMLVRLGISGVIFLLFLLHTSRLVESRLLSTIENFTYDARLLLTMPGTMDPNVVIVDIDEKTLAAEGWPMPRDRLARLIDQLFDSYHVKVVGFDIVFADPDRSSGIERLEELSQGELADVPGLAARLPGLREKLDHDRTFADALRNRPVVLGYVLYPKGQTQTKGAIGPALYDKQDSAQLNVDFWQADGFTGNLAPLQAAAAHGGFFDLPGLDADGLIRRVPLMERFHDEVYPSLALAVTRAALGQPDVKMEFEPPEARSGLNLERVRIGTAFAPVDELASVMVPYRGHYHSFRYVPAIDVLNGKASPAALNGKIVLMGTSSAGLLDLRSTPVDATYAGVEVHANIVSGILEGRLKQRAPYYIGMEAVLLLLVGLLLAIAFPKVSPGGAAALTAVMLAALVGLAFLLWNSANLVMPLGVPVLFTVAVFLAQLLYGYFIETRRARDISKRFGEYVPPEIVEEMAANPAAVSMEGKTREMTVLFSDVRGFTSISEQLEAKELAELMNQFLTLLTNVIHRQRGTIDKYMGDAIMAFWGAPLDDAQHATHALQAAIELPKAIRTLDEPFAKRGWPKLHIGVGLSTGMMRVGNMGSEFRRAYTVMGDPVNLASRVEGLTKEYGSAVICSEFTRNAGPSDWSYRELDQVRVKGKDDPVTIYEPMGPKEALAADLRQELARHRGALKLYRAQQWEQAEAEFFSLSRLPGAHHVYELFLERIAHYRKNPPGEKWDGVFTFKTK